ncbi:hypothetical protein I79_016852 [Cricetulus griseus]|uniref:Uncharacterized protein n=1 Tax=Cricetulus griseus TaxID=10029 RepID=G3I0G7_CRIGR|nr:hypothetical protein I79_016852 [Cricetulus griseus]
MAIYMLCTWCVYICGSNVSGGEQVSLSTKADFACGCSPLASLLACLGIPPGPNFSFSPNTHELHPYQQLNDKGVKAMGSQFIHISLMTPKVDLEKMTLNVQRWASLQGSPNKHSAWHLLYLDNRDPAVVSVGLSL